MRNLLLSLTILAGATLAGAATSQAAPTLSHEAVGQPTVQTIQYYEGWRHDGWHRHEAWARWHRHQEWIRWHRYHG